jgi:hypothetical protein
VIIQAMVIGLVSQDIPLQQPRKYRTRGICHTGYPVGLHGSGAKEGGDRRGIENGSTGFAPSALIHFDKPGRSAGKAEHWEAVRSRIL